ncbi:UbiA family prenyltransferase [Pontibacter chinhatensis]|uniref:UbiA prenyltransferase family protein n=1 Tax=Pontibacter chinhatensis TaxID=1436961 RepID=A0A1I2U8W8_9BACT|nr:UbiA family prenyltransferase [Pontibacter chinhatensis]SFG73625.1 UbiA prenyltransferase family protein [Pontibacter chinhatensis]
MSLNRDIGIREAERHPRRLLEGLLYSSVFISCCGLALTAETYLLAGLPVSWAMAVFVFLATLFTYNLSSVQSIVRRPRQSINRHDPVWGQRHKRELAVLGLLSIAMAVGVYFWFGLRVDWWFLLHLAIISVGYTVPVLYKQRRVRPLRSVPLLKVFLIAYVWAVVTAMLPLLDAGMDVWQPETLWLFLRRFLFILALALLFDIRDFSYDRNMNTLTFPGWIGVRKTKLLSLGLLGLYMLVVLASGEAGVILWALLASALGAAVIVWRSAENRPRAYFAILADGAMLLHAGLVVLATVVAG